MKYTTCPLKGTSFIESFSMFRNKSINLLRDEPRISGAHSSPSYFSGVSALEVYFSNNDEEQPDLVLMERRARMHF